MDIQEGSGLGKGTFAGPCMGGHGQSWKVSNKCGKRLQKFCLVSVVEKTMKVLCGGMQSVSCPADVPLQPWREGQPAADGDTGTVWKREIRRSETHWLAAEQKLGMGECGLRAEAAWVVVQCQLWVCGSVLWAALCLCPTEPLSSEHPLGASMLSWDRAGLGDFSCPAARRIYSLC